MAADARDLLLFIDLSSLLADPLLDPDPDPDLDPLRLDLLLCLDPLPSVLVLFCYTIEKLFMIYNFT